MKKIAIFASGNGSNAENIIRYFQTVSNRGKVALVVCNRPDAFVLRRAELSGVPTRIMTRDEINNPDLLLQLMDNYAIDFVVLAGFLLKIPPFLIEKYHNRIINIHPSLLPKYGGKGMYGRKVHEAVVAAGEKETGITIHYVSEAYDEGQIAFQARTPIDSLDTPEEVERKIYALEREHFPRVIDELIQQ